MTRQAAALTNIPAAPLSDEVAEHYGAYSSSVPPIDERLVDSASKADFAKLAASQHKSRDARSKNERNDAKRLNFARTVFWCHGTVHRGDVTRRGQHGRGTPRAELGEMARQAVPNPHSSDAAVWPPHVRLRRDSSARCHASIPRLRFLDQLDLSAGGGNGSLGGGASSPHVTRSRACKRARCSSGYCCGTAGGAPVSRS